ncbi:MAG: type VI secretion system tube protein Hcp [Planctomycetes bacterium]|nr:type VI secretion system tube protein Hcp [Planctomycetota bacterium]MCA8935390.1 type VI secretion system tube protein Hcp [Planctomycetota bacterium]
MASMKVFVKIDGMPGSSSDANHGDWCDVRGFNHGMEYPFDMRENKGRGEPVHGACSIVKEIDKASPKIYEALAKKKKVNKVELEFWRDHPTEGGSEKYFTIELEDCRIVQARPYMPTGGSAGAEDAMSHMEEVGFAYRKIGWTFLSGGQVPTTFDFSDPDA